MDELDDADDSKYHGDDPEKGSSHYGSPFVVAVCTQRSTTPNDNEPASGVACSFALQAPSMKDRLGVATGLLDA